MPKLTPPLIVAVLTVGLLWFNFSRHEEIWHDAWRSDNLTGYNFQEAPDYFKHLENRKIAVLVIQESLILVSGLLVLKGLKKDQ
jgi:hypothetical protein